MTTFHSKVKSSDDLKIFKKQVFTEEPRMVLMSAEQLETYLKEYDMCIWKPVSPYPGLKALYSEEINTYVVNHPDYDYREIRLWFSKHKFDIMLLKNG